MQLTFVCDKYYAKCLTFTITFDNYPHFRGKKPEDQIISIFFSGYTARFKYAKIQSLCP